ncbi:MAG: hypothetical protein HY617_04095 [Candidatus Sungbacteria bacterium]|nr:hypothetical protein [Candidatus Sungbacteria bacterium]
MKEFSFLAHFFVAGSAPRRRRESYALLRCSPAPRTALKSENSSGNTGFTFIEIIIVAGIATLLAGMVLASFINSRNTHDLTTSRESVISFLRTAQARTLAGEDGSVWGVHLEQTQAILFRGSSYASATYTQAFLLPQTVQIAAISLTGGGADVVFKQLSGETDQDGSFTMQVPGSAALSGSVVIEKTGKVYESQPAATPSNSRVFDTRHRSYQLGWSIQDSANLKLTFSDPPGTDTVVTIPMAGYFDGGKTKFDWSGTNTIGGFDQVLRIHTLALSGADTALSIDRDCRLNTKKVKIEIDASWIATYEADCRTLTVGSSGGTITEP